MDTPRPQVRFPSRHRPIRCRGLYHHHPFQLESILYLGTRMPIHRCMITQPPHAPNWCKRPTKLLLPSLPRRPPSISVIRNQLTQSALIKILLPHRAATYLMRTMMLVWRWMKLLLSYLIRTFHNQPVVTDTPTRDQ